MYKGKWLVSAVLFAIALVACPTPSSNTISTVSIDQPSSTTLNAGQSVNLHATLTGTGSFSNGVIWSKVGGGTFSNQTSNTVTFTAPSQASASITTIKATSVQDPSKFGTGELNINAAASGSSTITAVSITPPASTNLTTSASVNLSVAVTGTGAFNPAVTWEVSASSGTTGFLTNQTNTGATYTAPSQANTVTIRAISVQDSSKFSEVVFNVAAASSDTTPPTIASTTATSSSTVVIVFSEAIAAASIVAAQFDFSPSLTSSAAVLGADGKTVTVTTSAQTHLTSYVVLLNNKAAFTKVKDLAGNEYVPGNDGFHASFDGF